jgi:hypothetical protein
MEDACDGDRSATHRVAGVHARHATWARVISRRGASATCTSRRGRSAEVGNCSGSRSR